MNDRLFELRSDEHVDARTTSDFYDSVIGTKRASKLKGDQRAMHYRESARRQRIWNKEFCEKYPEKCK